MLSNLLSDICIEDYRDQEVNKWHLQGEDKERKFRLGYLNKAKFTHQFYFYRRNNEEK